MFDITPYRRIHNGTVQSYNPFRDFDSLERAFFGSRDPELFKTDIKDLGESFKLESELPGFKKEDIKLDLDDDTLTVTAERKSETEEKDAKNNYVRRERSYGTFSRSFDVSEIDTQNISAEYADGILSVILPKKKAQEPKSTRIEIK